MFGKWMRLVDLCGMVVLLSTGGASIRAGTYNCAGSGGPIWQVGESFDGITGPSDMVEKRGMQHGC